MTRSRLLDAIAGGDVSRVAALLHPDTPLNPAQGPTPLYRAAVRGNQEIVRLLIEHGADPDRPSRGEGEGLPLCAAACGDHAEAVQALLDEGADPNARDAQGWTALLWAAAGGNLESADVLLDAGADPDAACDDAACDDGDSDDGDTPLTLATRFGAYGIVWSLLEHGADPSLPGSDGEAPLDIARRWAAADLEAAMREEVAGQADGDVTVLVARTPAADGTQRITVEAKHPDGTGLGMTRQCGHAAIVTVLEMALDIRPPVEELLRRALPYRDLDEEDETWWAAVHASQQRHDEETFAAACRLCESDDPIEREFGVDVLSEFGQDLAHDPFHERSLSTLRAMAVEERDPQVVEAVLHALGHHADERSLPEVLAIVNRSGRTHTLHDPVALAAVLPPDDEDGLATLIRLTECADDEVRDWATMGLAGLPADTPRIREALATRLDDRDLSTVAEAARGLAARGDRRAIGGVHRVLSEADDDQDYARDLALEAAQELGLDLDAEPDRRLGEDIGKGPGPGLGMGRSAG